MFYVIELEQTTNFDELVKGINFEPVAKGRQGAHLFLPKISNDNKHDNKHDDKLIPLVRTSTIYSNPAQEFTLIHLELVKMIKTNFYSKYNIELGELNNGLVEIYTPEYKTMGAHSDQALDLEPNSYIYIYSHYSEPNPPTNMLRILEIENKTSGEKESISLTHNSIIAFDTNTNKNYLHKIILPPIEKNKSNKVNKSNKSNTNDIKWLGFTLRTSKTFIKFIDSKPYVVDTDFNLGHELKLATEEEKKEFYILRSKENKTVDFSYPDITYTISGSDLINPFE